MSAGFAGGSYTQSANAQERNQEATVFVGGLDENVTDELLWELMIQAGPVKHVYIPRDRITRQAQGYGFCEFRTEDDAQYAVKILNMVKMFMKPIKVQPSSEHKRNLDVGANIFVGNLDPDVDEKLLHDTFNAFGVIIETPHIMRDLETGNSKGYGFVKFNAFEASDAAIEAMNGGYIMNRSIVVQYAYKKDGNSKERHGSEAERLLAAKAQGTTGQTRSNAAAPPPAANGNMGGAPHGAGPGGYSQGPPPQGMPRNGPPAHSGMQPPQGPPPQVMAPPGMAPHRPPPQGPPPQGVYGYNAMRGGPEGNPMPKGMPPPMRQPGSYGYGGGPVGGRPPGPPPPGPAPPSHPPPYRQGGAMYPPDGRGMPPPIPPRGAGADQVPQYGMQQPPGYRGPPPVPNAGPPSGARPPPPPTGQHGQPPGHGVSYGSGMQRAPSEMPPPPPPRNPPNAMPPPPQSNRQNGY